MSAGARWCWCPTCEAWVGSEPPLLPPYWPNEKAAWMHRKGTGHKVSLLDIAQVLELVAEPVS